MSHLFGPARQNGVVVRDLDRALDHWTGILGVGPFFRIDNVPNEFFFQGDVEMPNPQLSIALGNWGDLQVELICPHGEGRSTWHNFLQERGEGLHHTSVWSRSFDKHVRQARDLGFEIEARGKVVGGVRYAYLRSDIQPLLEIAELTDDASALFEHIRAAAVDWDGRDPVRTLG